MRPGRGWKVADRCGSDPTLGTSHGSARWATAAEVRALRPRRAGGDLIVGEVGRWRPRPVAIPEGQLYEHTLLVAPNGTGKTAGLIVPCAG